jgi:hypothetical protein
VDGGGGEGAGGSAEFVLSSKVLAIVDAPAVLIWLCSTLCIFRTPL